MKVLRLCFKNLNSLTGVWEIDFKHPDFVSSGIFAITGPTGAGKTTILDAICLALYGQTPRLGRITQGDNEIMSRQTGECFAEVEFETAKGHFRCHWSQHRSRRLADGQLQSPRHEIVEAGSGMILESKLRAVAEKVEDVTGMDFDRFTRSMLLAQGGFAAFLQARPDERAPILEQITGTAIYSRISIKVHERTTEERTRLAELRAELEGIALLSPAEAEALLLEKDELHQSERVLSAAAVIVRTAQSWRERMVALETELVQLDQDQCDFKSRKATAEQDLECLHVAGRALTFGGEHAHLLSMRTEQRREQGEGTHAEERLPQLKLDWQAAFDALECAEAGLAGLKTEQLHEAELIRLTRELDVRLGEAHAQLQSVTTDIETFGRRNSEYRCAINDCIQRIDTIADERHVIAAFLDEHQVDAGLVGALTGIEHQLKSLSALDMQCRTTQGTLVRHAALVETVTQESRRSEDAWQDMMQIVAGAEQLLAELRAAAAVTLQGRELSVWREDAEALAVRQSRLGQIQDAVARIEEIVLKRAELKLFGEGLEQKRIVLGLQEGVLISESDLREQIARRLQDTVMLLNRVRSLEDDRNQLVDGTPCPLCGASEHPYAAGNVPQLNEAQQELELALAEAKRVRELLSQVKQDQVAVAKDIIRAEHDVTELEERRNKDETLCALIFTELGVMVDAVAPSDVIRYESELCGAAMQALRGILLVAEQQQQEERSALAELNTRKDDLAGYDKARLAARLRHEAALAEGTRLVDESAALCAERDRVRAEVECVAACYGGMKVDPGASDDLFAALTGRRSAYVLKAQARELLEKNHAEVVAEQGKQQALLAESEKMLFAREQQLRDKVSQRDALVERRLEQYGERNPDSEEKRLADALRLAGEVRETALQEQNRLCTELGAVQQQIERLSLSIAQRGVQLSEREVALSIRLGEAGFVNEEALLEARLPQERFDALTKMAEELRKDETALQTRYQDRKEALAGEVNKKLTDTPLDLIREENAAVTLQLAELQKKLGAVEHRLQQHADQQQRHQTRFKAIEIQKVECDRWERLHFLIGSGDGKKFRNFAQGLTFELMVAHANRQLQKMSDRYILIRDSAEPLELNVIDNYQAGEIRSTKNLSGGESFIASLALSLGLSSMASRNVRVDSLFLDEGFGTLDEDALETALETLSGLQQDGKLIGIISHVPALKERIGTQIIVDAGSAGRSTLSGPGCRRVD